MSTGKQCQYYTFRNAANIRGLGQSHKNTNKCAPPFLISSTDTFSVENIEFHIIVANALYRLFIRNVIGVITRLTFDGKGRWKCVTVLQKNDDPKLSYTVWNLGTQEWRTIMRANRWFGVGGGLMEGWRVSKLCWKFFHSYNFCFLGEGLRFSKPPLLYENNQLVLILRGGRTMEYQSRRINLYGLSPSHQVCTNIIETL